MSHYKIDVKVERSGTPGPRTTRPGGHFYGGDILSCDNASPIEAFATGIKMESSDQRSF